MPIDQAEMILPEVESEREAASSLTVSSLLGFLVGSRHAILQVARSRSALWIGLLFVLSAGFAREYDGADLWRESWHLMLPLAASLGTSFVLYALVYLAARSRGVDELSFASGYRTLLTFYWWTAPLAWLYAIPVERFLPPGEATAANLWFLAIVSVWRVLLITRALSVWLNASFIRLFFIVMLFADSVALLLALFSPKPIFDVMGGIRLSQPDAVLLETMISVIVFGGLSWLVWLIGAIVAIAARGPRWSLATVDRTPAAEPAGSLWLPLWRSRSSSHDAPMPPAEASGSLWLTAVASLVFGVAILPIGQPEQRHRWQVERLLKAGELDAAVQYMAQLSRDDLPPVWDPPPRVGYGERKPSLFHLLMTIDQQQAPEWVRITFAEKLSTNLEGLVREVALIGNEGNFEELELALSVIAKHIPAESLTKEQRHQFLWTISQDERLDASLRDRLREYLESPDGAAE